MADDVEVKVDTKLWDQLRKKLPEGAHVQVGVIGAAGAATTEGGITMIELAAIHEFGSPKAGIPERSFIRSTFDRPEVLEQLQVMAKGYARAVVADKMTWEVALGRLGAWAAAQIKGTIKRKLTTGPNPQENAPSTIARKGSSTPLIDTGRLINAITWLVKGSKK